jgi:hypothetical protein
MRALEICKIFESVYSDARTRDANTIPHSSNRIPAIRNSPYFQQRFM